MQESTFLKLEHDFLNWKRDCFWKYLWINEGKVSFNSGDASFENFQKVAVSIFLYPKCIHVAYRNMHTTHFGTNNKSSLVP